MSARSGLGSTKPGSEPWSRCRRSSPAAPASRASPVSTACATTTRTSAAASTAPTPGTSPSPRATCSGCRTTWTRDWRPCVDPAAIALHALWRTGARLGERVAIAGAGPIGLLALQLARIQGASRVIALDIVPQKLELARQLGADGAYTSAAEALERDPDGFDVVIETSGVNAGEENAVLLAGRHGRVAFIGIPNAPVTLSQKAFDLVLRYEVSLMGSWNSMSAPFPGDEWRVVVDLFATGRLRGLEMITDEVGVSDVPTLLPRLADRSEFHLKALVFP